MCPTSAQINVLQKRISERIRHRVKAWALEENSCPPSGALLSTCSAAFFQRQGLALVSLFWSEAGLQAGSMFVEHVCCFLLSLVFSLSFHRFVVSFSRKQHVHCALYSQLYLSVPAMPLIAVCVSILFFFEASRAERMAGLLLHCFPVFADVALLTISQERCSKQRKSVTGDNSPTHLSSRLPPTLLL